MYGTFLKFRGRKMPRRAFLVTGPEGSGTHMLTDAFVSAGCHEEARHRKHHHDYRFNDMPDLLVFHRSMPHAQHWPDLRAIAGQMVKAGYVVQPLLIVRDWHCTVQSVIRRDDQRDAHVVERNMRRAIYEASSAFSKALIYVTYESFCQHKEFRRWLFCEKLGLPEPMIEIKYANEKYYG
jgi:hypothetical protein